MDVYAYARLADPHTSRDSPASTSPVFPERFRVTDVHTTSSFYVGAEI